MLPKCQALPPSSRQFVRLLSELDSKAPTKVGWCKLFVIWITDVSFTSSFLFVNDGVDHGYSCDIDNVADRAFEIGEMNRFVQSHLDRADEFRIRVHCLQQFVTGVCWTFNAIKYQIWCFIAFFFIKCLLVQFLSLLLQPKINIRCTHTQMCKSAI